MSDLSGICVNTAFLLTNVVNLNFHQSTEILLRSSRFKDIINYLLSNTDR